MLSCIWSNEFRQKWLLILIHGQEGEVNTTAAHVGSFAMQMFAEGAFKTFELGCKSSMTTLHPESQLPMILGYFVSSMGYV